MPTVLIDSQTRAGLVFERLTAVWLFLIRHNLKLLGIFGWITVRAYG